jgi:tryptophan halogenase
MVAAVHTPSEFPRTVGVIGGGTAGYFAALALKRRFRDLDVTIVDSSEVPIIGVGEATTTLMPPFLHEQLGLDIVDFFESVRPTFKLGIKFLWGPPEIESFTYPFGAEAPIDPFVYERDLRPQSLTSLLMGADRGPVLRGQDGTLQSMLPSLKFAYHLDNHRFVAYLTRAAGRAGIHHVDARLSDVEALPGGDGIAALRSSDGRDLRFDFYVDATGFRSLLLGHALNSPFESYASSLLCDRAIVATVPRRGALGPYTTAETMNAGWCWQIPFVGEDHRGYVHASAFLDEGAAIDEMRLKNPGMGEPWIVRFRSGRHRDFWIGNTVGIGNSYGFVEPLESTALHMVILEVGFLLGGLARLHEGRVDPTYSRIASHAVGAHWDYLRWFLAVHYRYNGRLDTPFWRAARADVDVSGVEDILDRFRREGPWHGANDAPFLLAEPTFGPSGLMMMLLGQHAPGCERASASKPRVEWDRELARQRALSARALPHREALDALAAHPHLLAQFVSSPTSWCHGEAELLATLRSP